MLNLNATCTQAEFGEFVGISQPAVSDLLARTVIHPGHTAGQWHRDYINHLREQAAGRGSDGKLADARTKVAEAQHIKLERENKKAAGELLPIDVVQEVLAHCGRQIVSMLEPLPSDIHKICSELSPEQIKIVQLRISKACDMAAVMSLSSLELDEVQLEDATEIEDEPDFYERSYDE